MPEAVCSAFVCADLGLSPVFGLLVQRLGWPRARHEPFCQALQRQTWDIRPGYGLQLDQRRLSRRAVFKGISHDGFGLVFGTEPAVLAAIAVAQAALCGLPHAYQGKTSVVQSGVIGFVFGAGFVTLGTLWP
jgi:hypothetical protein